MSRKPSAVNHEVMHRINRSLVLSSLRKDPPQTRARLSNRTGLTRSAISYLTDELIQHDMIHEVGFEESTGGRRGILLELNPDGASAIAIKINPTSVQCALANFLGEVLWYELVALDSTDETYVLRVCDELIQAAFKQNRNSRPVVGIGAAVTGVISADGRVIYSRFMNWNDVDFRSDWEEKYDVNVSVDNAVNLAAIGENHYGNAAHEGDFIYIEIGHGLGIGIVIDGELYRGTRGFAGEGGFMAIQLKNGGEAATVHDWQSLVNIPMFMSTVRRTIAEGASTSLDEENLGFRSLVEALRTEDPVATTAMTQMSKVLGIGIANLVNIFDITVFIIGGELGKEYAPYLQIVRQETERYLVVVPPSGIELRISHLRPDAALMGAVARVFDAVLTEPAWGASY